MWPTILGLLTGSFPLVILIVIGVVQVIIMGPQWDRKMTLPNKSSCKVLDRKMQYYDEDIRYLITYINVVLPLMIIYTILLIVKEILENNALEFFALAGILTVQLLNFLIIRGIDKLGFIFNLISIIATGTIMPIINFPVSFFWVVALLIGCSYIIPHIVYFSKRYDLFWQSTKELKTEYGEG